VSEVTTYQAALADLLSDPRATGWTQLQRFVIAGKHACALADAEVGAGKQLLPSPRDVFNALRLTPLDDVRVVILGQDPYPTPGHAHGLAFSVRKGVNPLPVTLRNIFKELRDDLNLDPSEGGELTAWAKQGVLLLNASLSVEAGQIGAHAQWPWREATRDVISAVSRERPGAAFMLWGLKAQKYASLVDEGRHLIVASEHPSPLSASRGFFGSRPFSRVNAWLFANGQPEIRWGTPRQSRLE
jgi:uracil-DNA glycosylase